MRLAWFRPAPDPRSTLLDPAVALIAELATEHHIDVFDEGRAHAFIWMQAREPYALCIYEMANTARHAFIWPYLFHFPGVLFLQSTTLHDSRAAALKTQRRVADYAAEFAFDHGEPRAIERPQRFRRGAWPMLRAPLVASRLVVTEMAIAEQLAETYPQARVRSAPIGVAEINVSANAAPPTDDGDARGVRRDTPGDQQPTRFGVLDGLCVEVITRALNRAKDAGVSAELVSHGSVEDILRASDGVLALRPPLFGECLTPALVGMAAAKPVVVFETESTAVWPALDPQTWQSRGFATTDAPIVVSIDPRDEEHSLMRAILRLSVDGALRTELSTAAHDWWSAHATIQHAVVAWQAILAEAIELPDPTHPINWPSHLTADGTERAREILEEFEIDFAL